jgi:hypothetical protein
MGLRALTSRIFSEPFWAWMFFGMPGYFIARSISKSTGAEEKGGIKPFHFVITGVTAGVCAPLALFAIITMPVPGVPGGAGIWLPAGFYVAFSMWFGFWAALGGTIASVVTMGAVFGFGIASIPLLLTDFIEGIVPVLAFRAFRADPGLTRKRDWVLWIIIVPIASFLDGLWHHPTQALFGATSWEFVPVGIISYTIGDSIAVYLIGTPLLKALTRYVKATPLYVEGIFK